MLFSVYHLIANEVILDDIFKAPIVPQESKLDDMIAKFFPLHGLISIDIHLLEEVNEGKSESQFQFGIITIVVQMFEHDGHELINGQSFLVLLETLLYDRHLLLVEHLKDLRLSDFVRGSVFAFALVHYLKIDISLLVIQFKYHWTHR